MTLPHGSDRHTVIQRINARAYAIHVNGVVRDEDLHDETDINSNEDFEIAKARELAAAWARGETLDARHMLGITTKDRQ